MDDPGSQPQPKSPPTPPNVISVTEKYNVRTKLKDVLKPVITSDHITPRSAIVEAIILLSTSTTQARVE